jgi:formylglycine-generating enzyme required for sulfatase activity
VGTDGANPSCYQRTTGAACSGNNENNNGPVEQLDWYSALAYSNWLSTQHGLQPCYALTGCVATDTGWHDGEHSGCNDATFSGLDCTGYRLLTESEWERAARAETTTEYYWGNETDGATVGEYAWYFDNSGDRTQPVGARIANSFGLFDMSGNVWEWVWDRGAEGSEFFYLWIDLPADTVPDYLGAPAGTLPVLRGGTCSSDISGLRSAFRLPSSPSNRTRIIGFRLARTVPL